MLVGEVEAAMIVAWLVVHPIMCGLVIIVKVVSAAEQTIVGAWCDAFSDGRGDEIPAVVISGVGFDALFHGGFHALRIVDELCAVFDDEVGGIVVAHGAADGELAAFGDGHLVVGGHFKIGNRSRSFGKTNGIGSGSFAAVVVGFHGEQVGGVVVQNSIV